MKLSDFDYNLPLERIAQYPVTPRDHSRLLILNRKTGEVEDKFFYDLPDSLGKGDVLILNNTKVFPARLIGKKEGTGGRIEVFLLSDSGKGIWQCLLSGTGKKEKLKIIFSSGLEAEVIEKNVDNTWDVSFNKKGKQMMKIVDKIGQVPLPPYIKRKKQKIADKKTYQTVFAEDKKNKSVAAPTAGLHFTPALINKLKKKGVQFEYVTLHVGLGTFASVKVENIKDHKMHSEWVEADKKTLERVALAKKEKRRIIAVGTTSVRTIESIFKNGLNCDKIKSFCGWTDIFIYPGYRFRVVDAMITNFHVPKSSLMMLVSAFAGENDNDKKTGITKIKKAYGHAIKNGYRFFSYGDAMFLK